MTTQRLWLAGAAVGAAVACLTLQAQPPAPRPEFEVASIRAADPLGPRNIRAGVHVDGSQVTCAALSLTNLVTIAWRVKDYQVSGPDFMASERFDIKAKLPDGAAEKDVPAMLQSLLADRFGMKLHHESRDVPVYALVRGKGELKMQESAPDPAAEATASTQPRPVDVVAGGSARGVSIDYGNGSSFSFGEDKLIGRKLTAARTAEVLARFSDRPVIDMTGLQGQYDFVLELSPEDYRAMLIRSAIGAGIALPPRALQYAQAASGDSLFSAVQKLGLKLDPRKAPLDVLVIDHVEKAPTDN